MSKAYASGDEVWVTITSDAPCSREENLNAILHTTVPPGEHAAIISHAMITMPDAEGHPLYGVWVLEYDQIIISDRNHLRPRDGKDGPHDDDRDPNKPTDWSDSPWKPSSVPV